MSNGFDQPDNVPLARFPEDSSDSIVAARERNHAGRCGIKDCTNPVGEATFMGVRICDDHDAATAAHLRHLLNSDQ